MTGTREKLRSLVLVTLMVLSVFGGTVAFSGSVAAAHNGGNTIFDNRGAIAGDESPLDANVSVTSDTSFQDINISFQGTQNSAPDEFDGNFSLITDGNVVIRIYDDTGTEIARYQDDAVVKTRGDVGQTGPEAITVGLTSAVGSDTVPAGGSIYVEFTDDFVNPSEPGLYESPTFEFNPGSTGGVFSGHLNVSAAGAGPLQEKEVIHPNTSLTNGSLVYCGQNLVNNASQNVNSGSNAAWEPGESVNVQRQTETGWDTVATTTATETTTPLVYVDTDGFSAGDYRLRGEINPGAGDATREIVHFTLVCQDLSADFNKTQVQPGASNEFIVNSNKRTGYTVHVTSPDLSDETIDAIFQGQTPNDGDFINDTVNGVEFDVPGNQRKVDINLVNADGNPIALGNYTLDVDVNDTDANASDYVIVSDAPRDAQLQQGFVEVAEGDLATYTVDMQNTNKSRLVVGSEAEGYEVAATLTDGNGDGEVTVVQNTYRTGRFANDESEAWVAADSDDSVTANLRTDELDSLIDAAEYDLSVQVNVNNQWVETDLGALVVEDRFTGNASTYIAPRADMPTLNDPAAIAAAKQAGTLTESGEVANGDVVVHQLNVNGIFGMIASAEGDEAVFSDAGLETVVDDGRLILGMEQQNPGLNRFPKQLELDVSRTNGAIDFVADQENNSLYVVAQTGTTGQDAHFFREDPTRQDIYRTQVGDEFGTALAVPNSTIVVPGDEPTEVATTGFSVVEPSITFDTDHTGEVIIWKPDNTNVSGTSTLAPGTDMQIRLRSTEGAGFIKGQPSTIQADGTFTAGYNFSGTSPTKNFTASTEAGLTGQVQNSGMLIERPTASATINDQTVAGPESVQTVTVASVSMNYGGYVTIHDASLAQGATFDSVAGTTDYLAPGSHSDVQVRLGRHNLQSSQQVFAMPHRDTDDDQTYDFIGSEGADDGPYTNADTGEAVAPSAQVTVSTPTATPTDDPATPTPTDDPSTPTATDTPTSGNGPGFGLVAALVALLAAALIAVRRD